MNDAAACLTTLVQYTVAAIDRLVHHATILEVQHRELSPTHRSRRRGADGR